jgi:hypothetical protein
MKTLLLSAGLLVAMPPAFCAVNFDSDPVGHPPAGWNCGITGEGQSHWTVEADASAPSAPNVLKQDGRVTFSWCVKSDTDTADGMVEVKFKAIAGKEDQAAGVVWRWKDSNNYYVARANALEQNVSLYYTVGGSRKTIKYVNAPVAANAWHTLRVRYKGEGIAVELDRKTYIETRDAHILGRGKAGVWTKADSVTVFDDFSYSGTAADKGSTAR